MMINGILTENIYESCVETFGSNNGHGYEAISKSFSIGTGVFVLATHIASDTTIYTYLGILLNSEPTVIKLVPKVYIVGAPVMGLAFLWQYKRGRTHKRLGLREPKAPSRNHRTRLIDAGQLE